VSFRIHGARLRWYILVVKYLRTLNTILFVQIALWVVAVALVFRANNDGKDNYDGLIAIFPLGLFYLLGMVSVGLFIACLLSARQKTIQLSRKTVGLFILVIILGLSFGLVSQVALLTSRDIF
jgi:hypothetical protein